MGIAGQRPVGSTEVFVPKGQHAGPVEGLVRAFSRKARESLGMRQKSGRILWISLHRES